MLLNQPPNIPDSLQATSHIPKQGCSGWDQDGEAEVKRRTPAGRGLEICSQGQWLRDQDGSQNFHPQTSTIPSTRRLKQVQERRGTVSPAPSRGLGKGDGLKLGISRAGPGRGGECSKRWGPGPPQAGLALTKQLSMEQETRAVRLMVAGGLGQRTCPRSRCAAHQSRALAASRLRGPPGAAAAARRRARWQRGLRATPARFSPPFHNGASSAPPSRTSAEGRGARQGEGPGPRREGGRGAGPRSPAHSPRHLSPHSPSAAWEGGLQGTFRGFQESGLSDCSQIT